jgi:exonuclease 3'-5' domain-containing protein 1
LLAHLIFQIAFPDAVYLVDAIEGGKELVEACKPALESDCITKVTHDCRRDSEVPNYVFLF